MRQDQIDSQIITIHFISRIAISNGGKRINTRGKAQARGLDHVKGDLVSGTNIPLFRRKQIQPPFREVFILPGRPERIRYVCAVGSLLYLPPQFRFEIKKERRYSTPSPVGSIAGPEASTAVI